jgi:hypothetical protein
MDWQALLYEIWTSSIMLYDPAYHKHYQFIILSKLFTKYSKY